jgi:hypothetical protein
MPKQILIPNIEDKKSITYYQSELGLSNMSENTCTLIQGNDIFKDLQQSVTNGIVILQI